MCYLDRSPVGVGDETELPVSQMVHPLKPPLVPTTCPLLFLLTWWA